MRQLKSSNDKIIVFITLIITKILLPAFLPALVFLFAWLGGVVIDRFVGETLVNALNFMINATRATRDLIPFIYASLVTVVLLLKG